MNTSEILQLCMVIISGLDLLISALDLFLRSRKE